METEKISTIEYITKNNNSPGHTGELLGIFDPVKIKIYIKKFGPDELFKHLAYMQHQVIQTLEDINDDTIQTNGLVKDKYIELFENWIRSFYTYENNNFQSKANLEVFKLNDLENTFENIMSKSPFKELKK